MKRRAFVQGALLGLAGSSTALARHAPDGVRRLSSDRNFTSYSAGLEPAYTVKPGEIVLVECVHGMPGLVICL